MNHLFFSQEKSINFKHLLKLLNNNSNNNKKKKTPYFIQLKNLFKIINECCILSKDAPTTIGTVI